MNLWNLLLLGRSYYSSTTVGYATPIFRRLEAGFTWQEGIGFSRVWIWIQIFQRVFIPASWLHTAVVHIHLYPTINDEVSSGLDIFDETSKVLLTRLTEMNWPGSFLVDSSFSLQQTEQLAGWVPMKISPQAASFLGRIDPIVDLCFLSEGRPTEFFLFLNFFSDFFFSNFGFWVLPVSPLFLGRLVCSGSFQCLRLLWAALFPGGWQLSLHGRE